MTDLAIARVVHVVAVVLWIGGVAMVTAILLPALRARAADLQDFERIERGFSRQSRVTVALTIASGLYLVWRLDLWSRFAELRFWWMHAMVATAAVFAFILFVGEPLIRRKGLGHQDARSPAQTMRIVQAVHWILLAAGLGTVAAAVAGSHGFI